MRHRIPYTSATVRGLQTEGGTLVTKISQPSRASCSLEGLRRLSRSPAPQFAAAFRRHRLGDGAGDQAQGQALFLSDFHGLVEGAGGLEQGQQLKGASQPVKQGDPASITTQEKGAPAKNGREDGHGPVAQVPQHQVPLLQHPHNAGGGFLIIDPIGGHPDSNELFTAQLPNGLELGCGGRGPVLIGGSRKMPGQFRGQGADGAVARQHPVEPGKDALGLGAPEAALALKLLEHDGLDKGGTGGGEPLGKGLLGNNLPTQPAQADGTQAHRDHSHAHGAAAHLEPGQGGELAMPPKKPGLAGQRFQVIRRQALAQHCADCSKIGFHEVSFSRAILAFNPRDRLVEPKTKSLS